MSKPASVSKDLAAISRYFPDLTAHQLVQLEALQGLFAHWNAQINVISRKDFDLFYERHVLHSLGIAKVLNFAPRSRVLDVGTGGGFPGIPLAILFPETHFHLVDSIGKKIKVVRAVVEELKLTNVTAEQIRAEDVRGQFDFAVSRAVTGMPEFIALIHKKVRPGSKQDLPNGILYLKGGDLAEELLPVTRPLREFPLSEWFEEPFFETKKVVYVNLSA